MRRLVLVFAIVMGTTLYAQAADLDVAAAKARYEAALAAVEQRHQALDEARRKGKREEVETASALLEQAKANALKTRANYLDVATSVATERDRILQNAKTLAAQHAWKEADERARDAGRKAGEEAANVLGTAAAARDGKLRDSARGYLEGRRNAATDAALASFYAEGAVEGEKLARAKAASEDFAAGYNEALSGFLKGSPAETVTVAYPPEINAEEVKEVDGAQEIDSTPKSPGAEVQEPRFALPEVPAPRVPEGEAPKAEIPPRENRHHAPPCEGLALPEIAPLCRSSYDGAYSTNFVLRYEEEFTRTSREHFSETLPRAYETALAGTFQEELAAGRRKGATEQGVLDGFAKALSEARAAERMKGGEAFAAVSSQGYLVRVVSAVLEETSGDGLFTPSEKVKLKLVVDNLGGVPVPAGHLRLTLSKTRNLVDKGVDVRLLPELAARARTVLEGVVTASIGSAFAGEKLLLEGAIASRRRDIHSFQEEPQIRFPVELRKIVVAKSPAPGESVSATLTFQNNTKSVLTERLLSLTTEPRIVEVEGKDLSIPELAPGSTAEVETELKPGVWVGTGGLVKFLSRTREKADDSATTTQPFRHVLKLDRSASLTLHDVEGREVPSEELTVTAGSYITFHTGLRYHRGHTSNGPFVVVPGKTSHPEIVHNNLSTGGIDYGAFWKGRQVPLLRFSYNVPASLKGKRGWVMIEAREAGKVLHAMQIYLNIK